ncbi:hypothetical protein SAMN05216436_11145 [bacterium A37T11]|nr:hypothetical protein SAMN05216436_11145 [bacterium A37T11]
MANTYVVNCTAESVTDNSKGILVRDNWSDTLHYKNGKIVFSLRQGKDIRVIRPYTENWVIKLYAIVSKFRSPISKRIQIHL